jgi:hypothetical protein
MRLPQENDRRKASNAKKDPLRNCCCRRGQVSAKYGRGDRKKDLEHSSELVTGRQEIGSNQRNDDYLRSRYDDFLGSRDSEMRVNNRHDAPPLQHDTVQGFS